MAMYDVQHDRLGMYTVRTPSGVLCGWANRRVTGNYQAFVGDLNDGSYEVYYTTSIDGWTTRYPTIAALREGIDAT